MAGDSEKVLAVLKEGKSAKSIDDELKLLTTLQKEGLSTVEIISKTTHNGRPAIVMKRYAQGSKDVVRLDKVESKIKIVGGLDLMNTKSIEDLNKIKQLLLVKK